MLGKRTRPVIGKLSAGTSPRGPLGLRCYDAGGVGLGIVAALENKSSDCICGHEILAKFAICGSKNSSLNNKTSSSLSPQFPARKNCKRCLQDLEIESLEDYTYVTCHGPNNKPVTRVYYDGGDTVTSRKESSGRFVEEDESDCYYPTSDFLSSCHLCRKKLHGKDIYMYRGEKAFCSTECRSTQITRDERKEQCRADASRSADVAGSPYTRDHIFSTRILAI